jgi:Ca2+-binding EF-hand superfamily protein
MEEAVGNYAIYKYGTKIIFENDSQIKFIVAQNKSSKSAEELKKDPKWFKEMDKNNDGKIQPKEMDSEL